MTKKTIKNKICEGFHDCGWVIVDTDKKGSWEKALELLVEYLCKNIKSIRHETISNFIGRVQ